MSITGHKKLKKQVNYKKLLTSIKRMLNKKRYWKYNLRFLDEDTGNEFYYI